MSFAAKLKDMGIDLPEAPAPVTLHLVLPSGSNAYIAELARQAPARAPGRQRS